MVIVSEFKFDIYSPKNLAINLRASSEDIYTIKIIKLIDYIESTYLHKMPYFNTKEVDLK